jgi:hypothetical protein
MPAANEQFTFGATLWWRNGGSSPQTILCKFGRYHPAESSVEAATAPSRRAVIGNRVKRQCKFDKSKH